MPMLLFQYLCKKCGASSEVLVRGSEKPACPGCGSTQLEKQMSHIMPMKASASAPACGSCCAATPGGSCGLEGGCGLN